ncbi:hypothetical protein RAB80_017391 [Fusarium oxysporum f. sp. vasinfectum]|nr:hypothetical protein RAB80_017391 [Fusarium oxysporum f. sp. vasinfectum]KAK2922534.1 hypothetical protein FoTM2_017387 [Fusarium oxysporum f. sp. vasinfectum]
MSFPGAAPPPSGVEPNLNHPQDVLRSCNYARQALTIAFVSAFVVTRFYVKTRVMGGGTTRDDLATYTSYAWMIGYCITACLGPTVAGSINWKYERNMGRFLSIWIYCHYLLRSHGPDRQTCSPLHLIRVFGDVHKESMMGISIFIGMLVAYYVSGLFIKIFICWPISAYWKGETDKCLNQSAIIFADAIISVISDLVILLLPTPLTWSLQLSRRKRLRVIGILCVGGVATAFSIYRLAMILHEGKSVNQTIVFVKAILSGNTEAGIGFDMRLSSIYKRPPSSTRGEIVTTRSFHVDAGRTDKEVHHNAYDLGHDEAGLFASVQANPKSNYSSRRRSESTG